MTLDLSKTKFSTKSLVAFVMGLAGLLQVPAIGNPVMAFGQHHPHIAVIIGAITGIATLLHNPTVEAFLDINQTTKQVGDVSLTSMNVTGATADNAAKIVAAAQPTSTTITK